MKSIVEILRDRDSCTDDDIYEAADMIECILDQMQMYSPDMSGTCSYRFRNGGWPMIHLKGLSKEDAIRNMIRETENAK